MSLNHIDLSGNLTRDPELRETAAGDNWATFTVAVNERKKENGEWVDSPIYVDCTAFGRAANFLVRCELTKGDKLAVSGRLTMDRWKTKAGENRSALKVVVEDLEPMSGRGNSPKPKAEPVEAVYEEEIPF